MKTKECLNKKNIFNTKQKEWLNNKKESEIQSDSLKEKVMRFKEG